MERLPALLVSTVQSACEQFKNISFTVHGDSDKARISIVFTNSDNKSNKRKSKATIKRDHKRLREYRDEQSYGGEDTIDLEFIDASINSSEIVGSSSIKKRKHSPNDIENESTIASIHGIEEVEEIPSRVNQDYNKIETVNQIQIDHEEKEQTKTKTIESSENEDIDMNNEKSFDSDEFLSKVALMRNKRTSDVLIAETVKHKKLIAYNIKKKICRQVTEHDGVYAKYHDALITDFQDVRETELLPGELEKCLGIMVMFVIENDL